MSGNRDALAAVMPSILRHEGQWRGVYRHLDSEGVLQDTHAALVSCELPDSGPHAYIQRNRFSWPDGRVHTAVLPGILREGRLWWDTDTFAGSAWEAGDGTILLNLVRKDEPGAHFVEIIVLGANADQRARTWHWFKDGALYRRTLCDEWRMST